MNTVKLNIAIARPLVSLSNMSAKTAAVTARGQLPKMPEKNLQIMIVCKFSAVATAKVKRVKPREDTRIGSRRP